MRPSQMRLRALQDTQQLILILPFLKAVTTWHRKFSLHPPSRTRHQKDLHMAITIPVTDVAD